MSDRILLGRRLRKIRLEKQYSLEAVASDLNVSVSTLSRWECGNRSMSAEMLFKIARYYDISLSEMLLSLN